MRIVAGLLCILLIAGCSEKDKIPSDVIDKEEMGKILWDMMLADQYAANYIVKDSGKVNVKMETLKLYEEVFRLHKISRDEFRRSFQFYQERPDITRVMFDSLQARGQRARMENYARPPQIPPVVPQVKATDSALKARTVTSGAAKPVVGPPAGAKTNVKGRVNMNKPGGATPGAKPPVNLPNRGPAVTPGFYPNRPGGLPGGGQPFLRRESGQPVKAGELPFRPVRKDSATKSKQ